jgi:hypothetical protein
VVEVVEVAALDGCIRHTRVEDRERVCFDWHSDSGTLQQLGFVRYCIAVTLDSAITTATTCWLFFVTFQMSDSRKG